MRAVNKAPREASVESSPGSPAQNSCSLFPWPTSHTHTRAHTRAHTHMYNAIAPGGTIIQLVLLRPEQGSVWNMVP